MALSQRQKRQSEPRPAAPHYPERLLMGALTLNLTEGVQAADYTLVVQVRDLVGRTEAEARTTFRAEK